MKAAVLLVAGLVATASTRPVQAQAATGRISIQSDAIVEGRTVHLGDIADLEGDGLALADVALAEAPAVGDAQRLSGNEILARLREAGLDEEGVQYRIPVGVRVVRAHRVLEAEELQVSIETAAEAWLEPGERIARVELGRALRVPHGAVDVVVSEITRQRDGHAMARLTIEQAGEIVERRNVPLMLETHAPRVVFRRSLRRGEVLTTSDIDIEIRAVSSGAGTGFETSQEVLGRALRSDVGRGELATLRQLDAPVGVKRGDQVRLELHSGMLLVSATGEALESAAVGENVRVVNPTSGRELTGKVVSHGRVRVAF